MNNYSPQMIYKLTKNPLFKGIEPDQMQPFLDKLRVMIKGYQKDSYIFMPGDKPEVIAILLLGGAVITRLDVNGSEVIINKLKPGDIFGEVFVCSGIEMPVCVKTSEFSSVMQIPIDNILDTKSSIDNLNNKLIKNLLQIVAKKALFLNDRIEILSSRTIQQKIMKYLLSVSREEKSTDFKIPYNRSQLATFLAVDRSALSRELSKMKEDGLIDFDQNHFKIID